MTDFLRDPIWQFVGAILGLIAIVISLVVFLVQRRKKSLVYEIVTSTPLLTLNDEIKGKVQILYEGQPVQNVHLVILHIINDGNIAITSSDYEFPLTFRFGDNSQILSTEILKTTPNTLQPAYNLGENEVEFIPLLLNSGDAILFKVLLARYDGDITVNARVMGVTEVKRVAISVDRLNRIGGWAGLLGLLLMFSAIFFGSTAFIIGSVLLSIGIVVSNLADRRQKRVQVYVPSKKES